MHAINDTDVDPVVLKRPGARQAHDAGPDHENAFGGNGTNSRRFYRQDQPGWLVAPVKDPVESGTGICKFARGAEAVEVAGEPREVAAGYGQADAVAGEEHVMSGPEFHRKVVDLTRDKGPRFL